MTTTYGTLSTIAGFPVEVTLARRGANSETIVRSRRFRSSASRQGGKYETRSWVMQFGPEGLAAFLQTFDDAKGCLPVTWTPPAPDESAAIPVRFIGDGIDIEYRSGSVYQATAELEEVI